MRASGRGSVDLVLGLQQQHLATLYTFYLDFLLLAVLQLQGCDILELEFLRHGSDCCTECSSVNVGSRKLRFAVKLE
jgi:hypothetical protein